ncbi:agmatinase [Cladophialophora bantiana CBS 173.52]|uniref:Agmatinase n=1 Tax=Cladophialophora bantiana (strain ATCC 10958 / CBS 173.52 / CDC B-1940 / NIH 8579) TaxID=1442370 RepID=A0A0D2I5W9_CLAB1|nr:agmatinase [Cladophialophora bantiana CBS 173.52]KIW98660.1 agmatinase [Cladophialophora bantiana CBS 173.52]
MLLPSLSLSILLSLLPFAHSSFYDNPELEIPPESGSPLEDLKAKWDFDWGFSGIATFAHLRHVKCLTTPYEPFDIGIIGAPFDTAVSYRPGARFGPRAIRAASSRQTSFRGFNHRAHINPYTSWPLVLDCGDIPITPFDNALALHQMSSAYIELLSRRPLSYKNPESHEHPKLITLGGDHSVALPALRALEKIYKQPIAVLHFDAHLDTWHPGAYPSKWASTPTQADFTHGTMFWLASQEGLINNGSSVHAGLRTRLLGDDFHDYEDDERQGFLRIESDDIDSVGVKGIIDLIMERMGTSTPVYLSVDIDVIDPGLAPGTGTPEPGGWTTRELIQILRGVEGLNLVGADIVEVSPAYEAGHGEATALAGAQVVYEILTSMVKRDLKDRGEDVVIEKPGRKIISKEGFVAKPQEVLRDEL